MSNQAGKGSKPRPFSVPIDTYKSNYDMIFGKKTPKEKSEEQLHTEYTELVHSGMFWELHPELTGEWEQDKLRFRTLYGRMTDATTSE